MLQVWTTNLSVSTSDPELGIYRISIPDSMQPMQMFFKDMFDRRDSLFPNKGLFQQTYERRKEDETGVTYTFMRRELAEAFFWHYPANEFCDFLLEHMDEFAGGDDIVNYKLRTVEPWYHYGYIRAGRTARGRRIWRVVCEERLGEEELEKRIPRYMVSATKQEKPFPTELKETRLQGTKFVVSPPLKAGLSKKKNYLEMLRQRLANNNYDPPLILVGWHFDQWPNGNAEAPELSDEGLDAYYAKGIPNPYDTFKFEDVDIANLTLQARLDTHVATTGDRGCTTIRITRSRKKQK